MTERGFLTLGDIALADWPAVFERATQLKAERATKRHTTLADSNLRSNLIDFEQQLYANDPRYPINPLFKPNLNPVPANFRLPDASEPRITSTLRWTNPGPMPQGVPLDGTQLNASAHVPAPASG